MAVSRYFSLRSYVAGTRRSNLLKCAYIPAAIAVVVLLTGPPGPAQQKSSADSPPAPVSQAIQPAPPTANSKEPAQPVAQNPATGAQFSIAEQSARLLQMATELKAEVDKTGPDKLSLRVIRRADEIEHLTRAMHEKMKLTLDAANEGKSR